MPDSTQVRPWRWVSRSGRADGYRHVRVWQRVEKPDLTKLNPSQPGDDWVTVCRDDFEGLFGFLPEPGEVLMVCFAAAIIDEEERLELEAGENP